MAGNNQRPFTLFVLQKGGAPSQKVIKTDDPPSRYPDPISADGKPHGNSRIWGDVNLDVQRKVMTRLIDRAYERGYSDEDISIMLAIVRRESGFNPDAAAGSSSASGLGQFIEKTGLRFGINDKNRFDIDANISAVLRIYDVESRIAAIRASESKEFASFPKIAQVYSIHHEGEGASVSQHLTFLNDRKIDPTTGNPVYFNGPHRSGDELISYTNNARKILNKVEYTDSDDAGDALFYANRYEPTSNLSTIIGAEYDKAKELQTLLPKTPSPKIADIDPGQDDPTTFWGGDIATK